jgi:hypothetical protein
VGGVADDALECRSGRSAVLDYVRSNCFLYFGWRDSCSGCVTDPDKWGRTNDAACDVGVGVNNTCTAATLGSEAVNLVGLNTSGDVNNDDKFYVGFHCLAAPSDGGTASGSCPSGQLVTAVDASGSLTCASAASAVEQYVEQSCALYFGWRDSCGSCTSAPSRWGRVSDALCTNGAGSTNTCTLPTLGTEAVRVFGLNTGGDVGGDDKFYFGFECQ